MNSKITILSFSDVHLGNRKTSTTHIIDNLRREFADSPAMDDVDIIFIAGDLFDRSLNLSDNDVYEIFSWMGYLLKVCAKRNVILRILEGTPSHDWKQSRLINAVNKNMDIEVDVKFVPTLSVEYIPSLDINVLYVPDEWSSNNDDTWMQVLRLLDEHNLKTVDFAIMHGNFEHQLPEHVVVNSHKVDRYSEIVERYVLIGHVHNTSQHENVLAPGSFDRIAHGEEGAKGYFRLEVNRDGDDYIKFVENKNAKIYRTIDCREMNIEDAINKISNEVDKIPPDSHIRVWATAKDVVSESIGALKAKYPTIVWSSKVETTKSKNKEILEDRRGQYKTVPITEQTIADLVKDRLVNSGHSDTIVNGCLTALREVTT